LKFFTAQDGIFPVVYAPLNDAGEEIRMRLVLYVTHNGGTTWAHTTPVPGNVSKIGDEASVIHDAVADMNHVWVQQGDELHVTSDGGRQWVTLPSNPLFADVIQLEFISSEVGWAVGRSRGIMPTSPFLLKTLDGGRTWSPVTYTISR
jgi:photosystem II stability/assembly factor-like uncharacterized protein